MQENSLEKRKVFIIELLCELKDIHGGVVRFLADIEGCSSSFFIKLFHERKAEIQEDIDCYKENLERIKQFNRDITVKINQWYEFVKEPEEMKNPGFPIKFHINKRKLEKYIKKTKESISNITIENRFIMERITNWEHQLELGAIQSIKEEADYKLYEKHLSRKDAITSELKYLLNTLPNICPVELDLDNIDAFIEMLSNMPANRAV